MAGECCRRSESRYMTPFPLNQITSATSLKPFVRLPKEKPALVARASNQKIKNTKRETRSWGSSRYRCSSYRYR